MNNIKLDKRLGACADFVRKNSVAADIGTDHGFLPTYLVLSEKIKKAIACDINEKPLESAKKTIESYNVASNIDLRLSNGLENVKSDEFSDLIIAGMGAELIIDIISAAPYLKSEKYRLILQPMTKAYSLRKHLCENGFSIIDEKACEAAGKVYTVICAEYTGEILEDELFFYVGALEKQENNSAIRYKQKLKNALIKKANGILKSDKENQIAKELLIISEKIV